ncbi:MAG TPA: DegT/DnrJ/EryC1/StrS family aminotransferase [Phycisphaerae bacterium]|nr:DegT/DnrJ/EryC1/StrS family aminotransferase [Phycisphaerae bacterium]
MAKDKLAVLGGRREVPERMVRRWPPIDDRDQQMVLESLLGGKHAFGPNCEAFQREFAAWNGNRFAITTNSGTAALHMCLAASGCGAGDEVIVPAYSWSSSATCVLHHNAIPVFVDIDWDTMNLDADAIEQAITEKTRAIIVVHLHGLPADMEKILPIAAKRGLKVIEDACQAHGATFAGRKVGTLGHCGAFSFNQNKCLCAGEGGMFVTDDEQMLGAAQSLWSFGETRTPLEDRDYHAYALGWMYRNSDLPAAFGRAQLQKLDGYLAQQRINATRLTECLVDAWGLILPAEPEGRTHCWYNYTIRFDMEALGHSHDASAFRDRLIRAMRAEGVLTEVWQKTILPAMTVFRAKNAYGKGCPWQCPHSRPVEYRQDQYPVAQKHADWHTGMTTPLRSPNGPEVAEATARGIRKVMGNLDQLERLE